MIINIILFSIKFLQVFKLYFYISQQSLLYMCYTNVVFNQNITKNVDRDEIQRQRINDRVGFQSRFQTAGNLIFKPQIQSSLYVENKQRFNKDHNVNDQIKRENQKEKEDRFYQARLNKRLEKEQQRWAKYQKMEKHQQDKRLIHQKVQLQNNKNSNRLGYNPITLAYDQSERGQTLKQLDQKKLINRYVRTQNVVQKNNTGFNIITGEPKVPLSANIPEKMRARVEQKYTEKKQRQAIKYEPKKDKYDYLDDQN